MSKREIYNIGFFPAFTLAEVLITLGIIGVVAAMTIPTLVNNIQDKQFKEAAKKAYSISSQVIAQMKMDEGGNLDYYNVNANSFKPVFMKYFKVVKDCYNQACVPITYDNIYTALGGASAATSYGGEGQFVTADGMFFNIENLGTAHPWGVIIIVDVNSYTQKPNIYGKDTFASQVVNSSLVPMGAANTQFPIGSGNCSKNNITDTSGLGCMYNVMQGINY